MSFDLRISDGDLVISSSGDLDKVEDTDKLAQDVLKILITPIGGNRFFTWYGSLLASATIGSAMDSMFVRSVVENQIDNSLQVLQRLQRDQQSSDQPVSASELLAAIKQISVERNAIDPTLYTIDVDVLSRALKAITLTMNIT